MYMVEAELFSETFFFSENNIEDRLNSIVHFVLFICKHEDRIVSRLNDTHARRDPPNTYTY